MNIIFAAVVLSVALAGPVFKKPVTTCQWPNTCAAQAK